MILEPSPCLLNSSLQVSKAESDTYSGTESDSGKSGGLLLSYHREVSGFTASPLPSSGCWKSKEKKFPEREIWARRRFLITDSPPGHSARVPRTSHVDH